MSSLHEQQNGQFIKSKKQHLQQQKLIKKVNETVENIAQITYQLQDKQKNQSYYGNAMLFSARSSTKRKQQQQRKNQTASSKGYKRSQINKSVLKSSYLSNCLAKSLSKTHPISISPQQSILFLTQSNPFYSTTITSTATSNQFLTFINHLYQSKSNDLKTNPNQKQRKLFVQRFRNKFVRINGYIQQVKLDGCDLGKLAVASIMNYFASNITQNISLNQPNGSFVRYIILDKNPLGDQGVMCFSRNMHHFKSLQKLSLMSVNMSPKGARQLLKSLTGHQTLKDLNLSSAEGLNRNRFGQSSQQFQSLLSNPLCKLSNVNLCSSHIPSSHLMFISNGLLPNSSLSHLNLSSNDLCSSSIQSLLCHVRHIHLTCLNLQNNNLTDESLQHISAIIGCQYGANVFSKSLTRLNLAANKFRSNGIQIFCRNMNPNNILQDLDLSRNHLSQGGRFNNFKYFIARNWTIKKLHMVQCFQNTDDIRHLCQGIEENKGLEWLNISKNSIPIENFASIAKMLAMNKTLKHLQIAGCNISDKYIQKFYKQLRQIKSLQHLNISNNYLSDKSGKLLLQVFTRCKSLLSCVIQKNTLSPNLSTQLHHCLLQNSLHPSQQQVSFKQLSQLQQISSIQQHTQKGLKQTIEGLQRQVQKQKVRGIVRKVLEQELVQEQVKRELKQELQLLIRLQMMVKDNKTIQNNIITI